MPITELKDDELDGVSGGFARGLVKPMSETHTQLEQIAQGEQHAGKTSGSPAAKAPAPMPGGPDAMARAMAEQASHQKEQATDGRLAARQAAQSGMGDQAAKMKEAADKMAEGVTKGLASSVVASAVQIATSLTGANADELRKAGKGPASAPAFDAPGAAESDLSIKKAKLGEGMAPRADDGSGLQAKFDELRKSAGSPKAGSAAEKMLGSIAEQIAALEKLGKSAGTSGRASGGQADAKFLEAEGARDAAQAAYMQGIAEQKAAVQDSMKMMIEQIITFVKELQDAKVDQMRAVTRG